MDLCIFPEPSLENDSLNKTNPESVIRNAHQMINQRVPYYNSTTQKDTLSSSYHNRETN